MVTRAATLRLLLALVVALWTPPCLCHGARGDAPHAAQAAAASHTRCGRCPAPDRQAPGHDHNRGTDPCDCPETAAAAPAHGDLTHAQALHAPILFARRAPEPAPAPRALPAAAVRRIHKRPPATLLDLHCALVV